MRSRAAPGSIPQIGVQPLGSDPRVPQVIPLPSLARLDLTLHPIFYFWGGLKAAESIFPSAPLTYCRLCTRPWLEKGCIFIYGKKPGEFARYGYSYRSFSFTAKINGIRRHFLAGCGIKQLQGLVQGFTILRRIRFWFLPAAKYPI